MSSQLESPLISVIVVVFNGDRTLQRCIDSFSQQTLAEKEFILIDGGSTDTTLDIVKNNAASVTYWESGPDRGIYDAMNKGIRKAKGEWICFLGADDYFFSENTLRDVSLRLKSVPDNLRIGYGQVAVVNCYGETLEVSGRPWAEAKSVFFHEMSIPHQGTFHRKTLFERHGLYRDEFKVAGDYELLLRELKDQEPLFFEGLIVSNMEIGGLSSRPETTLLAVKEFRTARKYNGLPTFSFWLLRRELRARIRILISKTLGKGSANFFADIYRLSVGKKRLWTRRGT